MENINQDLTVKALNNLAEGSGWSLSADSTLEWLDTEQTKPTDAEITTEVARLQAEYDAQAYARDRQYPSIGDQLDALFHAGVFPAEMAAEIQAVKDKYPKA
jgi:hypothetical protein